MTDLADFPITRRWPPKNPAHIQYYGWTTPNGQKVSIALEELALPYDAHPVRLGEDDQHSPAFLSLNPNNKIPAIIDPDGPGGRPLALFESGAILVYLAEKTGRLLPADPAARYDVLQWLMWQMGGLGPMFGQLGWFRGAGKEIEDRRPVQRYEKESARLLRVLDQQLADRSWICGDYSIADIATAPWLRTMRDFYKAGDVVGWDSLENVPAYLDRFLARDAVRRGLRQPPTD